MAVYHVSDTHFWHTNVARYCGRPWQNSVEEMVEALVARWNTVVGPHDRVWHYGDAVMGGLALRLPVIARLNGDKIIIPGNHDGCWSGDKRAARFRPMYEEVGFTIADEQVTHTLTDEVTGETFEALGCHFPYVGDSHDRDRYDTYRPVDNGLPLIHGHVHDKWLITQSPAGSPMINVGVDAARGAMFDYAPVPEQAVIDLIMGRTPVKPQWQPGVPVPPANLAA